VKVMLIVRPPLATAHSLATSLVPPLKNTRGAVLGRGSVVVGGRPSGWGARLLIAAEALVVSGRSALPMPAVRAPVVPPMRALRPRVPQENSSACWTWESRHRRPHLPGPAGDTARTGGQEQATTTDHRAVIGSLTASTRLAGGLLASTRSAVPASIRQARSGEGVPTIPEMTRMYSRSTQNRPIHVPASVITANAMHRTAPALGPELGQLP